MKEFRPRLTEFENFLVQEYRNSKKFNNVLVIGDIHEPFCIDGYLDFCYNVYIKYRCSDVVFIGDLIDNHFSSYHETDPDGMSVGDELDLAKDKIHKWHEAFPVAKVCLGNHDLIPKRKAHTSGLSSRWIRSIKDILNLPDWDFREYFFIDDVFYTHGTGKKARMRATADLVSIVQGHYHSESYIYNFVGKRYKIFAMQVGCGIDSKSYAMAYGRHFNKPHINCGVVLNDGQLPILEYMEL